MCPREFVNRNPPFLPYSPAALFNTPLPPLPHTHPSAPLQPPGLNSSVYKGMGKGTALRATAASLQSFTDATRPLLDAKAKQEAMRTNALQLQAEENACDKAGVVEERWADFEASVLAGKPRNTLKVFCILQMGNLPEAYQEAQAPSLREAYAMHVQQQAELAAQQAKHVASLSAALTPHTLTGAARASSSSEAAAGAAGGAAAAAAAAVTDGVARSDAARRAAAAAAAAAAVQAAARALPPKASVASGGAASKRARQAVEKEEESTGEEEKEDEGEEDEVDELLAGFNRRGGSGARKPRPKLTREQMDAANKKKRERRQQKKVQAEGGVSEVEE